MDIFKIIIICIVSTVLCVVLRPYKSEYSVLIAILTAVLVLIFVLKSLISPLNLIADKIISAGVEIKYFKVALKAVGIGYVTSFAADICKDAGQISLSSLCETAGKCAIFVLSIPLLISVCDMALGFIK
jgi:stage III sporulation protein AD